MEVENVKISKIVIGERFREEPGNLDELADSIKAKGLLQPITVDTSLNLVAGERRLRACKRAKLETIPAVIRDIEDETDAREIELFENIHRKEMTWKERVNLTRRIHDLKKAEAKANGKPWSQTDTAKMLGKSDASLSQAVQLSEAMELVPELQKCSSEKEARGRYKKLLEGVVVADALKRETNKVHRYLKYAQNHYIIGDAIQQMGEMHTGVMDFGEVDPPYGIELQSKKSKKSANVEHYNEVSAKEYPKFIADAATEMYRILRPDRFCIWWFGVEWYSVVLAALKEAEFSVDPIPAIWYKVDSGGVTNSPQTNLARCYEPFFVCRKGVPELRTRGRSNVFSFKPVAAANKAHPTERPVPLLRDILNTFVYPGAKIVSPFLGSGNTILASYANGSICHGWDLSKKYKETFLGKVNTMFEDEMAAVEGDSE